MNEVICVKLINGVNLICKLVTEKKKMIIVQSVFELDHYIAETGQSVINVNKHFKYDFTKSAFELSKNHILSFYRPDKTISDFYYKIESSDENLNNYTRSIFADNDMEEAKSELESNTDTDTYH